MPDGPFLLDQFGSPAGVAAAGVLAAFDHDVEPGLLIASYDDRLGPPLLSWVDPFRRFGDHPTDLAVWWSDETAGVDRWRPGVRLSVEIEENELPRDLLAILSRAPGVHAVSTRFADVSWRVPVWNWPLRLSADDGWGVTDVHHRWWDHLVRPVPARGRWAEANVALLPFESDDTGDVRARAVVVGAWHQRRTFAELRDLARRHHAAVVAEVDGYLGSGRFVDRLVIELSHDQPVDTAIMRATDAVGGEAVILAHPRSLETSRIRAVMADVAGRPVSGLARPGPAPTAEPMRLHPDERGYRLAELLTVHDMDAWESEAGDASDCASLLREDRADRRIEPDRYLGAALTDTGGSAVTRVAPGSSYVVAVGIAADAERAAAGETPFPQLAFDGAETDLTVVLTDLRLDEGEARPIQQRTLRLPRSGDSPTVTFPVITGPVGEVMRWRVAVLHRNRFVQTGLLTGIVGDPAGTAFAVEAVVRADLSDLDTLEPHQASLVLNHTPNGTSTIAIIVDGASVTYAPRGLAGALKGLTPPLARLVNHPDDFVDIDSAAFHALLIDLARHGRGLRDRLFGDVAGEASEDLRRARDALRTAERISVLSQEDSTGLPIEFLYDRDLAAGVLDPDLELCPDAREHALSGDCPVTADPDAKHGIVCPSRFWAVAKVIERHITPPRSDGPPSAICLNPDVDRHVVRLGPVLAAASIKADHNEEQAWSSAAARLGVDQCHSWVDLMLRARERREHDQVPDIVLLLTHVTVTSEEDILLEIGDGDSWSILNDFHPLLEPRGELNPIVIVLGCGTAGGEVEMFRPPGRLLMSGAPAVVACLVTVLGRHIVPVAVELVEALRTAAAADGDGAPLGDALRTARRRCIASGNAAVMALTALGASDWQLRSG